MRDRDLTRWERAWLSGEALVLAGVLLLAVLVSVAVLADLARAWPRRTGLDTAGVGGVPATVAPPRENGALT
jgi:hypothetical protein